MRITIIADSFPPLKNSAAVLVFSLAEALSSLAHEVLVITPASDIAEPSLEEDFGTFKVLRLRCGEIKSHIKFVRGIQELSLFFSLPRILKKTVYKSYASDLIIWYSPSIFFGGLVRSLKRHSTTSYLILRDIFPQWLVDVGLMRRGLSYYLLRWFEIYQYRQADFIGVQSPGNIVYIENLELPSLQKLEVLPNWMPSISTQFKAIDLGGPHTNLSRTILAGRKVLVYAGNLGEAQGVENFAQLLYYLRNNLQLGFLIIGRGSKKVWLQEFIEAKKLTNVLVLDEVDLATLNMYYRQSDAGLVFLDLKHKSHNIPGKFISYLEAGLPVVACVNANNDLVSIIQKSGFGLVGDNPMLLADELSSFFNEIPENLSMLAKKYYDDNYRPKAIALQILKTVNTSKEIIK
ncbi:glycosyltransferase WbuB [Polynucleobacter paneuropaeus]|uniref:glycosyltransferase family 4 protein n=1 Tax=Polynucleobacter paneuropaeus TaxID=2527775 RepID=UPI000DBEF874|nr:glycosyltransferase family 4 protein [Polynucleobacter paneuropaeus]AWW45648.1 glycosyltransferase WbuB [Polynucleobacter paneuropaeus]